MTERRRAARQHESGRGDLMERENPRVEVHLPVWYLQEAGIRYRGQFETGLG